METSNLSILMQELRDECMKDYNLIVLRAVDKNIDHNSTNLQLIQAIAKIKTQLYLFQIASSILMGVVTIFENLDNDNLEIEINKL